MTMPFIDFFPRAGLNVFHGFSEMVLKGHFVNWWNWHWVDSGGSAPDTQLWPEPSQPLVMPVTPVTDPEPFHMPVTDIYPGASTQSPVYPIMAHWPVHPSPALLWSSPPPAPSWQSLLPCSRDLFPLPPINALCEWSPLGLSLWFCLWATVEWSGQIKYFNIFSLSKMNQKKGTI